MEKLSGQSMNLTENNIDNLKQLFPEVFTEGKIDFDKLRLVLGDNIEENDERYQFAWYGKSEAIKNAQTPSMGTLRLDRESSKKLDTTGNLYIEGDNLEVLKLLQKSYFGKIKIVYMDPPYNTGKDLIYKNDFVDSIENYKKQINGEMKANTEANGRYHTDWLNMMYPRLKLARNLLTEDGLFMIAIDHNELFNLGEICDEIFGYNNRIGLITVVHKPEGRNQAKFIGPSNEFMLMYAKNEQVAKLQKVVLNEEQAKLFSFKDEKGLYRLKNFIRLSDGKYSLRENKPAFWYPIYVSKDLEKMSIDEFENSIAVYPITESGIERTWKTTHTTFLKKYEEGDFIAKKEAHGIVIYEKLREDEVIKTHWIDKKYHGFHFGTKILDELLGVKTFDFPKSLYLMKDIYKLCSSSDDIIIDLFSGSGTSAHAIMQLNAEDNGSRKFIMVQLPEITDEKSEAYKAGYRNICEIAKERIRRAGDKVVSDSGKTDLDIGFKVFKLDDSNIKEWSPNYDELEATLDEMTDNLKSGRTKEDLLFEILIKMGIELTSPIEEINVGNKKIYNIGTGSLVICLEDEISEDIIKEIPKYKSDFVEMKVVFKETGFRTDSQKMNAMQNLKQFGIIDVRSV